MHYKYCRGRTLFGLCLSIILTFGVTIAHAQEAAGEGWGEGELDLMSLMELDVVVAATGKATSLRDAPAIVSVINQNDIRAAGYRTVADALRSVPGLSVVDDHVETNIGIRGFFPNSDSASDTVKLMINNQPVSFRPTASNFFGLDLIPIEAVKRIEVIRGPASALYGANAYLGVINVITKTGKDLDDESVGGGINGQFYMAKTNTSMNLNESGSVLAGGTFGDIEVLVAGAYSFADRSGLALPKESPVASSSADTQAVFDKSPSQNDLAHEMSAYTLISTDLGSDAEYGKLRLDGHFQLRDKAGEFLGDTALSHGTRIGQSNMFARLEYDSPMPDEGEGFYWDLSLSYANSSMTNADSIIDPDLPAGFTVERDFGGQALSGKLELNYGLSSTDIITLGLDVDHDMENLATGTQVDASGSENVQGGYGNRDFTNLATYTQFIYNIIEGLTVTAGARFDHNTSIACNADDDWDCFGSQTTEGSPVIDAEGNVLEEGQDNEGGAIQMSSRFAIVYNPEDFDFYLKFAYGSSYKAPTPYQLYHKRITKKGSEGQPGLNPQTADTFEGMVGYDIMEGLGVTLGAYFLETKNLVTSFKDTTGITSRNADGSSVGLEFNVKFDHEGWLKIGANASYLVMGEISPKQASDETESQWNNPLNAYNDTVTLARFPKLSANLSAIVTLDEYYLRIGTNIHFVGARDASLLNNMIHQKNDLSETYSLDPYVLMRLNITTTDIFLIDDDHETIFGLMFVGGTRQVDPGMGGIEIPGMGPSVFLKVNQAF